MVKLSSTRTFAVRHAEPGESDPWTVRASVLPSGIAFAHRLQTQSDGLLPLRVAL